jgi:hypothetical protein
MEVSPSSRAVPALLGFSREGPAELKCLRAICKANSIEEVTALLEIETVHEAVDLGLVLAVGRLGFLRKELFLVDELDVDQAPGGEQACGDLRQFVVEGIVEGEEVARTKIPPLAAKFPLVIMVGPTESFESLSPRSCPVKGG